VTDGMWRSHVLTSRPLIEQWFWCWYAWSQVVAGDDTLGFLTSSQDAWATEALLRFRQVKFATHSWIMLAMFASEPMLKYAGQLYFRGRILDSTTHGERWKVGERISGDLSNVARCAGQRFREF